MARKILKKLHISKKKMFAILGVIVVLAAIIIALFYVQTIEVTGNEYISDSEIIESMNKDPLSMNALYDVVKYNHMKPKLHGGLTKMKVSMKNPWTLKVTVTERQIIGYIDLDKEKAFFDKEGIIVLKDKKYKTDGIPCIEGLQVGAVKLYEKLEIEDKKLLKAVINVAKEVKSFELNPDRIVCTDDGIELYFGDICVLLGMNITTEQIAQIKPILERLEGQAGTLHLEHYNSSTSTITFKKAAVEEEVVVEPEDPADEEYDDEYYDDDYDDEYYDDDYYDDYDDGYYEEEYYEEEY